MTVTIPKTLLKVAGRPFVDIQLEWLASQGVRSVLYALGYLGEQIQDYVGDGARWGLAVDYSCESPDRLLGTAGALRLALDRELLDATFLTLYGDSYLTVDIGVAAQQFLASRRAAMMSVLPIDKVPGENPNAALDDGLVCRYDKAVSGADAKLTHIDYGLGAFHACVIDEHVPSGIVSDLATVQQMLADRQQLMAFEVTERFYEIGSPDGLETLSALLS